VEFELNSARSAARVLQDLHNSFSFIGDVRTLYNKTVLFYFYFSFIAVVRSALITSTKASLSERGDNNDSVN